LIKIRLIVSKSEMQKVKSEMTDNRQHPPSGRYGEGGGME